MGHRYTIKDITNQQYGIGDIDRPVTVSITKSEWIVACTRNWHPVENKPDQEHDVRDILRAITVGISAGSTGPAIETDSSVQ